MTPVWRLLPRRRIDPEYVRPDGGPRPDVHMNRLRFLMAIGRWAPGVLDSLEAEVFPLAPADVDRGLATWASHWHLNTPWMLDVARGTVARWRLRGRSGFVLTRQITATDVEQLASGAETLEDFGALPIHLATTFPFQPRAYAPLAERWSDYEAEMRAAFDRALREHRQVQEQLAREAGAVRARRKRARPANDATEDRHFEWLTFAQCHGWTDFKIAVEYDVDESTVRKALPDTANLIGLQLRTPRN